MKNYTLQVYVIFCHCYVAYGPILVPILIQIAYVVHEHAQFKMIAKESYENDFNSQGNY